MFLLQLPCRKVFPETVVESLLCKTPIVYFKETAIEDVCENKKIMHGYGESVVIVKICK